MSGKSKKIGLNLLKQWNKLQGVPFGAAIFSRAIGFTAPYSGSINATVKEYEEGHAVVVMPDRKKNRNHLKSLHAIALMNLGEIATGLAVLSTIDGRGRGIVRGLKMEYSKKARGPITATCRVVTDLAPGDHTVTVEGVLMDTEGDTVATMFATWQIEVFA